MLEPTLWHLPPPSSANCLCSTLRCNPSTLNPALQTLQRPSFHPVSPSLPRPHAPSPPLPFRPPPQVRCRAFKEALAASAETLALRLLDGVRAAARASNTRLIEEYGVMATEVCVWFGLVGF